MGQYLSGLGTVEWNPRPHIINTTDDFRYIVFDGESSADYGLIMTKSDFSAITPKRNNIEIPYNHGSLDVSMRKNTKDAFYGDLYFNDREVKYTFEVLIQREHAERGNKDPNESVQNVIQGIKKWLGHSETYIYNARKTLTDSALWGVGLTPFDNAVCTSLNFSKEKELTQYWIVNVDMTFSVDPLIRGMDTYLWEYPEDLIMESPSYFRAIKYNNTSSRDLGLIMTGITPIPNSIKRNTIVDSKTKDSYIYKSAPMGVPYFEDREIEYSFDIIFHKGSRTINEMNGYMQVKCEEIHRWLYNTPRSATSHMYGTSDFQVVMYGVTELVDDIDPESTFGFARCTDVSFEKSITGDIWILGVSVSIRTYPLPY